MFKKLVNVTRKVTKDDNKGFLKGPNHKSMNSKLKTAWKTSKTEEAAKKSKVKANFGKIKALTFMMGLSKHP